MALRYDALEAGSLLLLDISVMHGILLSEAGALSARVRTLVEKPQARRIEVLGLRRGSFRRCYGPARSSDSLAALSTVSWLFSVSC